MDALEAFDRRAAEDTDRYFILGAMNELGESAIEHHIYIGEHLTLRPQDSAVFVGPDLLTKAYQDGALKAGAHADQLQRVENVKKITSSVALYKGAIFLKGSRSYHLEELIPESIQNS